MVALPPIPSNLVPHFLECFKSFGAEKPLKWLSVGEVAIERCLPPRGRPFGADFRGVRHSLLPNFFLPCLIQSLKNVCLKLNLHILAFG